MSAPTKFTDIAKEKKLMNAKIYGNDAIKQKRVFSLKKQHSHKCREKSKIILIQGKLPKWRTQNFGKKKFQKIIQNFFFFKSQNYLQCWPNLHHCVCAAVSLKPFFFMNPKKMLSLTFQTCSVTAKELRNRKKKKICRNKL